MRAYFIFQQQKAVLFFFSLIIVQSKDLLDLLIKVFGAFLSKLTPWRCGGSSASCRRVCLLLQAESHCFLQRCAFVCVFLREA